jgi:hypothetical protein
MPVDEFEQLEQRRRRPGFSALVSCGRYYADLYMQQMLEEEISALS